MSNAKRNEMKVQVLKSLETEGSNIYELKVDTIEITTWVNFKYNYIQVIVKNASHKAWRGMGRQFNDFQSAIEAYKSVKVKAALEFVRDENLMTVA